MRTRNKHLDEWISLVSEIETARSIGSLAAKLRKFRDITLRAYCVRCGLDSTGYKADLIVAILDSINKSRITGKEVETHLKMLFPNVALDLCGYSYRPTTDKFNTWVASDGSKVRATLRNLVRDYGDPSLSEYLEDGDAESFVDACVRKPVRDQEQYESQVLRGDR